MSKARLVITAGVAEGLSQGKAARRYIGIGRTHARTHIVMLIQDLHVRIINAATGELLRRLTLDPARKYQPTGRPPRPTPGTPRKRKHPEP